VIDPLTAASLATSAFTGVKKFIEAGKSVEDTMMVMARWQGHVSDFAWAAKREQKKSLNPFKAVTFSESASGEAAKIYACRKKLEAQRKEVLQYINLAYGKEGLQEYRALVEEVKQRRQAEVYAAAERADFVKKMMMLIPLIALAVYLIIFIIKSVK
jgi:hypothetical protein